MNSAAELAGQFYAVIFSPAHLRWCGRVLRCAESFWTLPSVRLSRAMGIICMSISAPFAAQYPAQGCRTAPAAAGNDGNLGGEPCAAAAVAFCRARYVERIRPLAAQVYEDFSGREQFDLHYLCGVNEPHSCTRDQLRSYYQQQLYREREEDMIRGATQCGPHRDDLELLVNGMPMRLYGSQGQQRSGVLALKMAECSMVEEVTSEAPGAAGRCERTGMQAGGLSAQTTWTTGRSSPPAAMMPAFADSLRQQLAARRSAGQDRTILGKRGKGCTCIWEEMSWCAAATSSGSSILKIPRCPS